MRDEVLRYSAQIGSDPMLVQGAGGNVSWKDADTLWVKASGTWLADAATRDIFAPADLGVLRAALREQRYDIVPTAREGHPLRPSIETVLHALMPQRVVVHVHAVEPLAHLVRRDARQRLAARLEGVPGWACVDYAKPGAPLAQAVAQALQARPGADKVLLKNHGVVVGGDSVEAVRQSLDLLCARLEAAPLRQASTRLPAPFGTSADDAPPWLAVADAQVQSLALDPVLFGWLEHAWALFPDHVVFLGPAAVRLRTQEGPRAVPAGAQLVFAEGRGVYARGPLDAARLAQLRCYAQVLMRQDDAGQLASLSPAQVAELLNWDAETYRTEMNARRAAAGGAQPAA
jgi:rhamnose utilization protein RhaD (predicted bifunctional aldolase and dehydrogenase)